MMKNYEEIIDALKAGETLINVSFLKVRLEDGFLVSLNKPKLMAHAPNFETPSVWQIYKEPKWYENIPDGDVLCWASSQDGGHLKYISLIERTDTECGEIRFVSCLGQYWRRAKPLTKQEIQVFKDNAPEER